SRAGGLNGIATARCRGEGPTFRAAKCAHLGASAQGRLRGPSDRHHAARPGDSKSQETAQRDLREAYWPAAAEDRRGAGARFFYDGRDGQGFRFSRQGNRSSAGDATACNRVLNGHASWLSTCGSFHHQFVTGVIGSQQSAGQLSGGGSRKRHLMSALGQKRTSRPLQSMSALPPKADIGTQSPAPRALAGKLLLWRRRLTGAINRRD